MYLPLIQLRSRPAFVERGSFGKELHIYILAGVLNFQHAIPSSPEKTSSEGRGIIKAIKVQTTGENFHYKTILLFPLSLLEILLEALSPFTPPTLINQEKQSCKIYRSVTRDSVMSWEGGFHTFCQDKLTHKKDLPSIILLI